MPRSNARTLRNSAPKTKETIPTRQVIEEGVVRTVPYFCHICVAQTRRQVPLRYFPILVPHFTVQTVSTVKKKALNRWRLEPRELCIEHALEVLKEIQPKDLLPPGVGK